MELPVEKSTKNRKAKRQEGPDRKQSKHWVFTLNNPTLHHTVLVTGYDYIVVGLEHASTGTPHYQGYVVMSRLHRLSQMVKLQPKCNFEIAKGTPLQASNYCKKGEQTHDEWVEFHHLGPNYGLNAVFEEEGTLPLTGGQTMKRDWDAAFALAKQGRIDEIPASIVVQHYSNLRAIKQDYPQPSPPTIEGLLDNIWYFGKPRVGKSVQARKDFDAKFYTKGLNKWWDGYRGEANVLIDDFDKAHAVLGCHMKQWCDRYPFRAEMKGTSIEIRPQRIIVTSNYTPAEIFTCPIQVEAICARFSLREVTRPDDLDIIQ